MKKGIIYLLMSIFLLFIAENKQSFDFQPESQNVSSQIFSFAKKHHIDKSLEKASFQQANDSLDSPEEVNVDLSFSNSLNAITVLAVFGFSYLLHLYFIRTKQKFHEPATIICSVRRFILLRSIRI